MEASERVLQYPVESMQGTDHGCEGCLRKGLRLESQQDQKAAVG